MNKELFRSMREQMQPGKEAREALTVKLASAKKKTVPVGRYMAIAACAAVIVAAVPVYNAVQNYLRYRAVLDTFHNDVITEIPKPHSYVLASESDCWPEDASAPTENSVSAGGAGDRDMGMTPDELADNMLEAAFSQEDVDAYLASGWEMTWAKWWKFYHQAEESGEWTLEALLDFSREEQLAVSTGEAPVEIPGGAPVGEALDQSEAIMAYQNLMDRFKADCGPGVYPEWYGGAYIDEHAGLIVNIVVDYEPEDKKLFFQIEDWAGSSRIGFGSCQLSMNQLVELQEKTVAAMEELGLPMGCGINEETGQVELTLPVVTDEALWKLTELDPADTAILVIAGQVFYADIAEEPAPVAPSVSQSIQPGGAAEPGAVDNAIAWEPQG
ncbi:MAG: hypothetical protein K2N78_10115 [Oscillospiraceae bacterium]|nr:hypothetical protein [Oscillospiraceae bacterium]